MCLRNLLLCCGGVSYSIDDIDSGVSAYVVIGVLVDNKSVSVRTLTFDESAGISRNG